MDAARALGPPVARPAAELAGVRDGGVRGRGFIRAAEPGLKRLPGADFFLPPGAARTPDESGARHPLHRDPEARHFFEPAAGEKSRFRARRVAVSRAGGSS